MFDRMINASIAHISGPRIMVGLVLVYHVITIGRFTIPDKAHTYGMMEVQNVQLIVIEVKRVRQG